jgi:hypothetical protein
VLRIRDVYPGSEFFPIPSPTKKKEQGKNKLVVLPFLIEKLLIFKAGTEKQLSQFTQNLSIFNPKNCSKALRNMCWIRDPEKICPGSRGQKSIGSRIRNTAGTYVCQGYKTYKE